MLVLVLLRSSRRARCIIIVRQTKHWEASALLTAGSSQCPWHQCCFCHKAEHLSRTSSNHRATWFRVPSHFLALAGWRPPSVLHHQITHCHIATWSCSNVSETCPLLPLAKWQARTSLLSSNKSSFKQSVLVKHSCATNQRISFAYKRGPHDSENPTCILLIHCNNVQCKRS